MIIDRIVHPIDDQSTLRNVVIIVLPVFLFRLFAVDDELQNWRRHHGKRADEACIGNGRIHYAVGKARIHDDERQSDQNAVLYGHEAYAAQILSKNKAQHQKGRDKAEGIERQRLHIPQANRREAI